MVYAWVTKLSPETFVTLNLGLISLYPNVKMLSRMQIQLQKCYVAAAKVFGVGPCAVAQEDVNQIVFGVHPDADAREAKVPVCERARAVAA